MGSRILLAALALAAAIPAAATPATGWAEVRVLSAGAVEPGLRALAARFERQTGEPVAITFATGPQLLARVSGGERADLLVAPEAVAKTLAEAGRVEGPPVPLGRVGVGVAVKKGAARPDVSSVEALKRAVAAAKVVVYNRATTGQHMEKVFRDQGLAEAVAGKSERPADGEGVMQRLAAGSGAEIGFAAVTEIGVAVDRGEAVQLVAPLPPAVQNETTYAAAAFPGGSPSAKAFLALLTGPEGRAAMAEKGIR